MIRLFIGILLVVSVVIFGCQSIVDLNVPDGYESRLVIQSTFFPDDVWTVSVSQSVPFSDQRPLNELNLSDATVIITGENNFRDTLLHTKDGIYQSAHGHRPEYGVTYSLQVKASGFPDIEATSQIPSLNSKFLALKPIQFEDETSFTKPESYEVRFQIEDQPGRNYYSLTLYRVVSRCTSWSGDQPDYEANPEIFYSQLNTFQSTSPSFHSYPETVDDPTYPDFEDYYFTAYFSDRLFDGISRDFPVTFTPQQKDSIGHYFMFELINMSNDLFAHERTLALHDQLVGLPNITQRNPVVVHTNIRNGFGIFAGYTRQMLRFDAKGNEWPNDDIPIDPDGIINCHGN